MRWKSLGALAALVACLAVVTAVPAAGSDDSGATAKYIVTFVQAPAAVYEGGVAGYPATKPGKGRKFDAQSADAKKYARLLSSTHDDAAAKVGADKIYDFTTVLNGFAADLTEDQVTALESMKNVLSVEKNEFFDVDTSSTPAFLGLDQPGGIWEQLGGVDKNGVGRGAGEDMVIGDVDGGYWPENPAFSDRSVDGSNGNLYPHKVTGFSGICQAGEDFPATTCNNKVIAARYYDAGFGEASIMPAEFVSPRDYGGHGSHTASTMAGNYGVQATGDAAGFGKLSGMAPRARLAVYKACWVTPTASAGSCSSIDTSAAINQAVADGVDAINFSISGSTTQFTNSVELAFLNAAAAGVWVSASAGNNGPTAATVAHASPWIITTAAGTHNRDGRGTVNIDGTVYNGASSAATSVTGALIDSVAAKKATAAASDAALCVLGTLDPALVAGKIVVCDRGVNARTDKSLEVKQSGGIGMIMVNPGPNSINADLHFVPSIHLGDTAYTAVHAAAAAGKTATIAKGVLVYNADAPFTASFSSRGPLAAAGGDLLKPDIMAPGQDVLAAVAPPGNHGRDFDLYSGTSMSSPHMTALGVLIKQAHPDWTPMMIKSAFMTTAYQGHDYDPFGWGAGHVDANKALDPGLVFDSGLTDWLSFLKGQKLYTGPEPAIDASDLNLASIAIGDLAGSQTVSRKATSVGSKTETYTFSSTGLAGITVTPSVTSFTAAPGSVTPFTVTFLRTAAAPLGVYQKGFVTWTGDKGHVVKMAVVVQPVKFQAPTEASGSGTSGSLTYVAKPGYDGTLTRSIRGLQAATMFSNHVNQEPNCALNTANPDANVANGTATVNTFVIPAGSSYWRFQTFQADTSAAGHDLDMFIYRAAPGSSTFTQLTASGGPDANEVVSTSNATFNAAGTTYKVYVLGCNVDPGGADFKVFAWSLVSPSSNPYASQPAASDAVTIGQALNETYTWSGLPAGNRYLGRTVYADAAAPATALATTVVAVSTR